MTGLIKTIDTTTSPGYVIIKWVYSAAPGTDTWVVPADVTQIEYLVVAGGGGGGGSSANNCGMGGGGAGGMLIGTNFPVSGTISVTVGNGGAGGLSNVPSGVNPGVIGGSSIFSSISAIGGGPGFYTVGQGAGGSGGGASSGGGAKSGGTGIAGQGYNGGGAPGTPIYPAGGGGGKDGAGTTSTGGAGLASGITGVSVTYAKGGNGATSYNSPGTGGAGAAGTGNGGAGGANTAGSAGGSGVVVIKYVTPPSSPTLSTSAVTAISTTTATGNGTILTIGYPAPTIRGICYNTTGNPTTADSKVQETGTFDVGAFTEPLVGLIKNTTYHVKSFAINTSFTGYGDERDFTTLGEPIVTTQPVTPESPTTAKGNGTIVSAGGVAVSRRGICYNTTGSPTIADSVVYENGTFYEGAFVENLINLNPSNTYYMKAYAVNSIGISYGSQQILLPALYASVTNEFKSGTGVVLPISVSVTHEINRAISKAFTKIIDDSIPITDIAFYNGIASNDYINEPISISDSVETSNIDYIVEMDDSVVVTDKNYNVELFSDSIKVYDGVAATIFTPDTLKTVNGTQFYLSSQHPSPGTFVNVFKRYSHPIQVEFVECTDTFQLVQRRGGSIIFNTTYDGGSIPTGREPTPTYLPNGNLPNNYTIAGDNGSFVVKGLSLGVYVFVSIKPGYTFGWRRIDVTSDTTTVDLFLAPIMSWNYVEKIYNIYGHSLKMYHLSNYVDPLDGNRVVDGILVFGDLYGDGNQGNSTQIDSSGYLELDTTYNPGQLFLMSMPDLGEQGFFDIEQGEQVYGNSAHTRITWSGKVGPREFDGFAFRMKFPPDRVGILNLSIATGLVIPMPYGDGAPVIGIVSSGSRVLGSGTHVSGGSWGGGGGGRAYDPGTGGRAYDPGTGAWGAIPVRSEVAYTPSNPPPPYVPPPWNPTFAVSFTEGFSTFEEDMGLRIIRSGIYIEQLNFVDAVQVDEDFGTPPTLSMHGVAQNEAGAPIVGATVHLIAIRNGVVVGSTTSDVNGLWSISNLESELEYRVVVSAPLLGYYSTSANIQVYDKDIVDNRAWQILEAQAYNVNSSRNQFLDARIILPPMSLLGIADGRIWGEVTDAASGTSLGGVLVEAYPGWLAEGELDLYSPQIKSDTTGTRSFYVDGYYEIFVPKGKWTVRAKKGRFSKSQVYLVEMVAGYNLDIPIVAQVLAGTVYDRDRFNATGEKIPIAGATVSLGQYSTVTDSEGKYNLVAVTEEGTAYIINCIAVNYAEETRSVTFVGTDLIAGFDIYLMRVRIYGSIGGN